MFREEDRHLYLYARHQYQKWSIMADIRRIISIVHSIPPDSITDSMVLEALVDTLHRQYEDSGGIPREIFKDCIVTTSIGVNSACPEHIASKLLRHMMMAKSEYFKGTLGEADPTILPVAQRVQSHYKEDL